MLWHEIIITEASCPGVRVKVETDHVPCILDAIEAMPGVPYTVRMSGIDGLSGTADKVQTKTLMGDWQSGDRGVFYILGSVLSVLAITFILIATERDAEHTAAEARACVAAQGDGAFSSREFLDCLDDLEGMAR